MKVKKNKTKQNNVITSKLPAKEIIKVLVEALVVEHYDLLVKNRSITRSEDPDTPQTCTFNTHK